LLSLHSSVFVSSFFYCYRSCIIIFVTLKTQSLSFFMSVNDWLFTEHCSSSLESVIILFYWFLRHLVSGWWISINHKTNWTFFQFLYDIWSDYFNFVNLFESKIWVRSDSDHFRSWINCIFIKSKLISDERIAI